MQRLLPAPTVKLVIVTEVADVPPALFPVLSIVTFGIYAMSYASPSEFAR